MGPTTPMLVEPSATPRVPPNLLVTPPASPQSVVAPETTTSYSLTFMPIEAPLAVRTDTDCQALLA